MISSWIFFRSSESSGMCRRSSFDRHVVFVFLGQAAVVAGRAGNRRKLKRHIDRLVPPLLAEHIFFLSAGETDIRDAVIIAAVVFGAELLIFFKKLLIVRKLVQKLCALQEDFALEFVGRVLDIAAILDGSPEEFDLSHMNLVLQAVVGQNIQRKNIQEEPFVVGAVLFVGKISRGLAVSDLGMFPDQLCIVIEGLEKIRMFEFLGRDFFEQLVIIAEHDDIDVVVPGNKPVMTDSSQKGPTVREIAQAVLFAHCVQQMQHIQFHCPDLFHLLRDCVAAAHFLFPEILRYIDLQFNHTHLLCRAAFSRVGSVNMIPNPDYHLIFARKLQQAPREAAPVWFCR